jgi:hypothetical protein
LREDESLDQVGPKEYETTVEGEGEVEVEVKVE